MIKDLRIEVMDHRLKKAADALTEVRVLARNEFYNAAMDRLYFACYHCAGSLVLLDSHIKYHKDELLQYFCKNFVQTGIIDTRLGSILTRTMKRAEQAEFEDYEDVTKEELLTYYRDAKLFIDGVTRVINQRLE